VRAERNLCDALHTDEGYSSASLIWLASPLNLHADAAGRELTFSIIGQQYVQPRIDNSPSGHSAAMFSASLSGDMRN
jgi:hypothetical protein